MNKIPKSFVWGVATSCYQVEGACNENGKGLSIWDAFSHIPQRTLNGENGDISCDQYHRYPEDVKLMHELGVDAYRFSLAWSRIIPDGQYEINQKGIDHYNRLIDCLQENNIQPWVTLYHWDLPLALQLEHDGWLNRYTANAFAYYAKTCFSHFGDRVKHWITFNEPWCSAVLGHGYGIFAPGRKSGEEPYLVAHNQLIAHGLAVDCFRKIFQDNQKGIIGIANNCDWREPLTDSDADRQAAQQALEFFYGWFTDPVVFGDYPKCMRERLGLRLPKFTDEEKILLKNSTDFLGLNHYNTLYASAKKPDGKEVIDSLDGNAGLLGNQVAYLSRNEKWELTDMQWNVIPWGFRKMLNWINSRYQGLPICVTENGCAVREPDRNSAENDELRCRFIESYIKAMREAVLEDGVDVKAYFAWSLIDNFEWASGYSKRFGLIRCDFETLERIPKKSYYHYQKIIMMVKGK